MTTGLVPGDAVRAAAVVSLAVGGLALGGVAGALFLLVLGGTFVPRFVGLTASLDVTFSGSLLLAAWAAQLGWYDAVPWLDLVVHAVCTGLVAAVGTIALARAVFPEHDTGSSASAGPARVALAVTATGIGAAGAVLWELGEWAGHTFLDASIQVGYQDTMGDLACGLLGAAVAGAVLARHGRRSPWGCGHPRATAARP